MSSVSPSLLDFLHPLLVEIVKEGTTAALTQMRESQPRYPELIPVTIASEITGYSKASLYQMHCRGQIPGTKKIGSKLMFNTERLRKWIADGARKTNGED